MTTFKPFDGPRLKVGRARTHFIELIRLLAMEQKAQIDRFPDPQVLVDFANNPVSGHCYNAAVPPEFPLIVGDLVHNLRSALDIAVCDVARTQGKSTDKLKFPFAESAEKFQEVLKGEIRRLGPDILEVLSAFEPYRDGQATLRALHDLDIDDKHRLILPARFSFTIGMDLGPHTWSASADAPIKIYTTMLDGPFKNFAVVPIMQELISLTEGVIEALALTCGADRGKEASEPPPGEDALVASITWLVERFRAGDYQVTVGIPADEFERRRRSGPDQS